MITDNKTFCLCTLKDFDKVLKKTKIQRLKGLSAIKILSEEKVKVFDEKGLAYYEVPLFYPNVSKQETLENDYADMIAQYLMEIIYRRRKSPEELLNQPSFSVSGRFLVSKPKKN